MYISQQEKNNPNGIKFALEFETKDDKQILKNILKFTEEKDLEQALAILLALGDENSLEKLVKYNNKFKVGDVIRVPSYKNRLAIIFDVKVHQICTQLKALSLENEAIHNLYIDNSELEITKIKKVQDLNIFTMLKEKGVF